MSRLYLTILKRGLLVFLASVSSWACADDALFSGPVVIIDKQPKLIAIADRLAESVRIRSEFYQEKTVRILRKPLVSTGRMIYQRDLGLFWNVEQPFPSSMVISTDSIIQRSGEQSLRIDASDNPIVFGFAQVFFQLLSGDIGQLAEQFNVFFEPSSGIVGDESVAKNSLLWRIGLVPKDKKLSKFISRIVLTGIDAIDGIVIIDPAGDETKISLLNRQTGGQALSEQEMNSFAH